MARIAAAPFPGSAATCRASSQHDRHHRREHSLRRRASCRIPTAWSWPIPQFGGAGPRKIGVLVALESAGDKASSRACQAARHACAAARPQSLTVADLDQAAIERERAILAEKAGQSGKAVDIIAKDGRSGLRKFTRRSCCWSRPSSSTARPRSQGGRRSRQGSRRTRSALRASALDWARVSRRIRRLAPRWLHSSRSSMKPVSARGWMPSRPRTYLSTRNAAGSTLSPRPAEASGEGLMGARIRSTPHGRHAGPGNQGSALHGRAVCW